MSRLYLSIWVPMLPPRTLSPNVGAHWGTKHKAAGPFRDAVVLIARNARVLAGWTAPNMARLKFTFSYKTKRPRDGDNLLAMVKRVGQDALVTAEVLTSDDLDHLEIASPEVVVAPRQDSGVWIEIWNIESEEA